MLFKSNKRLLIIFIITLLSFIQFCGTAQNLSNGRVAHYPVIGNFNDVVGNNNGIVYGASLVEDRFGNPNSAYQLDGIDDYIRILHHANINFAYNEDFTISIWVKLAASQNDLRGNNNDVIRKWNTLKSSGYPYAIGYRNSLWPDERLNKIYSARYDSEVCSNNPSITNNCKITTEFWHHIIFKKQGEVITSYQDGVIKGTINDGTSSSCTTENTNDVTIGQRGTSLRYLTGAIDDLMFYNRALTENEILTIFHENGWVGEDFESEFTSFNIQGQTNQTIINNVNHTISLELPCYTDLSSLIAQFNTSKESIITVGNETQISGENTNDFTIPLIYTIKNDLYCFIQDWTVIVNLEINSQDEKTVATSFINFNIPDQVGTTNINNIDHIIEIQMPCYSDLTNLIANYELHDGTIALLEDTEQFSGITSNDFSTPIILSLHNNQKCTLSIWQILVTYKNEAFIDFQSKSYFIPNVITPNSDLLNEEFVIGEKLIGSNITILNRYGKPVFESSHYYNNFNGENLSSGAYYYIIRNKCIQDPIIGSLQIIK
ncbi:MAG: gliding motility-associated C-terminal domain-containing protein [Cyclobacteriaceae bacterium]|nr:gliding motility-associated C-terminal domain-containing protein [Cyclobacteriaceae bacterium]